MGKQSAAETRFRERLQDERKQRKWSRADLSKVLQDRGLEHIYPSTVAKIEGGERAVRIDEATAIADLFEVSVDAMLGRTSNPSSDLLFKFRANLDVARQSAHSVWGIATSFRQRTEEVSAVDFEGWTDFRDRCRRAWDALNDAHRALIEVADFPVPSEAQLRPPDPQTVREQAELRALFKEVLEAGRNRDEA